MIHAKSGIRGDPGRSLGMNAYSRFLVKIGFLFIVGFALAVLAMRMTGGEIFILPFDPPNCSLPCLVGITPGKTSYAEAHQRIHSLSTVEGDDFNVGHYFTDAHGTEVYIQL